VPVTSVTVELKTRAIRVDVPVLVALEAGTFTIREFSLNLSEGGIFVATDKWCAVGTRGTLRFQLTRFDEPFVLQAEVVRAVEPGREAEGQTPGLGIRFLDPKPEDHDRLRALLEGVRSGSIVEAFRRSIRESGRPFDVAIRTRPTSHKMMLAVNAKAEEINGLIRDGNPLVIARLLDCPRLTVPHVAAILRNRSLPTAVLIAIKKDSRWLSHEMLRWLFCGHPAAVLKDVEEELPRLTDENVRQIAADANVRTRVRMKAKEQTARRGGRP